MLNKTIYGVAVKWILIALAVLYILSAYSCSFFPFGGNRQEVDQAHAQAEQSEAIAGAATNAVQVVVENDRERETFQQAVTQGQEAINAAPIDAPPEVTHRAVVSAVCRLPEYRAQPQCQPRNSN